MGEKPHLLRTHPTGTDRDERGFSLMEAILGAVIAIIAVIGLAYSLSVGRGSIDRFTLARAADARAEALMDSLTTLPPTDPAFGLGGPFPFVMGGRTVGDERWVSSAPDAGTPGAASLRKVTVTVAWNWASMRDSVRYQRLFPL